MPAGSHAIHGFKAYTAASRHERTTWIVVDEASGLSRVRTGLAAGGRWIRTIGTPQNFLAAPSIPPVHLPQYKPASLATGADGSNPSPASGESGIEIMAGGYRQSLELVDAFMGGGQSSRHRMPTVSPSGGLVGALLSAAAQAGSPTR